MIEGLRQIESDVPADREILTVEQVAEYLQVHPETVRKWLREGALTGISLGGRARWRVRRDDLEEFITRQRGQSRGRDPEEPRPQGPTG